MTRGLTGSAITASQANATGVIALLELLFDSGTVRLCSAAADIVWGYGPIRVLTPLTGWSANYETITGGQSDPDGGTNAALIAATASGQNTFLSSADSTSALQNKTVTFQVALKLGTLNSTFVLWLRDGADANVAYATFNLTAVTAAPALGSATITALGGGWFMCAVTGTFGAGATTGLHLFIDPSNTSVNGETFYAYAPLAVTDYTWVAVGQLGKIQPIGENENGQVQGLKFEISSIPSGYLNTALTEAYQGRVANLYVAFLALPQHTLVTDPVLEWSGTMDVMTVQDDGKTGTIQITAESALFDFARPVPLNWADSEQQALYAGDLGLQYLPQMGTKQLVWPAASFFAQ